MHTYKRIYIEITNCCNLSCSFCPATKRDQAFMSLDSFEEVLKKLQGHGDHVYLHIKGEPMMHPEFEGILNLCGAYKVKVNLTTNGTLLKKHKDVVEKSKALRQVSVSLQSQENLDNGEAFTTYMTTILDIIQSNVKKTDQIYELRLWNYEDTIGSDVIKNTTALSMIMDRFKVSADLVNAIPGGKGSKLVPQVYLSKALEFQWPTMEIDPISTTGTCYGLRQQVGILVNGDVVPCCLDGEGVMTLGNIFDNDFESIVTGDRGRAIRQGFENRKLVEPLCQRCGYRTRFD